VFSRRAAAVPLDYLLHLEAREYHDLVVQRMDPAAFDPGGQAEWEDYLRSSVLAEAIEWPGVLADKAADLPPGAHDLPWLAMLADLEGGIFGPAEALLIRPQSILLPDLLPLMERHGLTEETAILREGMALFPDWDLNPVDRQLAIYRAISSMPGGKRRCGSLMAAIRAAAGPWPPRWRFWKASPSWRSSTAPGWTRWATRRGWIT